MPNSIRKMLEGYQLFREKYASGDNSVMQYLSNYGQKPEIMVVSCCDSRVDPALILQCDPGDLFVVRNVANIIPPFEKDEAHHGTSAALEFGIEFLKVKHLILWGHSQCGGIQMLLNGGDLKNDFISNWVSLIKTNHNNLSMDADEYAKLALKHSLQNCLTFPWIKEKIMQKTLNIYLWFFDVKAGQLFSYSDSQGKFEPLFTRKV
ncbi:MAG TPA: carbonic anhydrase [Gammaproteobacteria bacterium]|nr:carbonic anhydrase [Gammaproteobacteria bacterium]